tara:strand:- start:1518 stop:2012 length:495 start_codon:yes stop_codon:yes gene_type:complete
MENKDSFKLSKDADNIVELLYDQPKQGQNAYGAWYLYGVNKEGQETSFFATENLHKKLSTFGRGATVNIRKDEYAPGKFAWNVIPQGNTQPKRTLATVTKDVMDARTHDIHKQVCLKLAVDMIDKKNEILTTGDLVVIEANMMNLLNVLEGKSASETTEDKPPF